MAKVSIQTIENLQNETSVVSKINANFAALQAIIETLLSRDGRTPNQLLAQLDMNNRRIINLPVPSTPTEPARHGDIQQYVDRAEEAAEEAETAQTAAEEARDEVIDRLGDLSQRYLGSYSNPPISSPDGSPLQEGALYFNTLQDIFYVWTVLPVTDSDETEVSSWEPIPVNAILSMSDISHTWANNELVIWNDGQNRFIPFTLSAETVPYEGEVLTSNNTKDAIDEIVEKTTLDRYDLCFFIGGLLSEAECLFSIPCLHSFEIGVNPTFYAICATSPVSTNVLYLKKNGVQFGTITFSGGSNEGVLSIPGATRFNPGDLLQIFNQSTPDTALKDLSVGITATRVY